MESQPASSFLLHPSVFLASEARYGSHLAIRLPTESVRDNQSARLGYRLDSCPDVPRRPVEFRHNARSPTPCTVVDTSAEMEYLYSSSDRADYPRRGGVEDSLNFKVVLEASAMISGGSIGLVVIHDAMDSNKIQ